jgi:predicted dehydrogenase
VSGQALTLVPERKDKKTGEPWTATADDTTHFTLEFNNGALASVFLSGVARHNMDNHTQIFGSEGTLLLSNGNEKLLFGKPGKDFEDISVTDPNANLEGVNAERVCRESHARVVQCYCREASVKRRGDLC